MIYIFTFSCIYGESIAIVIAIIVVACSKISFPTKIIH